MKILRILILVAALCAQSIGHAELANLGLYALNEERASGVEVSDFQIVRDSTRSGGPIDLKIMLVARCRSSRGPIDASNFKLKELGVAGDEHYVILPIVSNLDCSPSLKVAPVAVTFTVPWTKEIKTIRLLNKIRLLPDLKQAVK